MDKHAARTWSNGKIIKGRKQIDSLNFALHYASPNAWEGIRSYKQKDGSTKIWKLNEHIDRFFDTAKIIGFEIPFTFNEIVQGCKDVVEANGGGDLYLRPIAYPSQDAESVRPDQKGEIGVDIYAFPIPPLHGGAKKLKLAISGLIRGYPQFEMQAKTAANYKFLQTAKTHISKDIDDILLIDNLGYITEATVANIFIFKGNVALTPPSDGSILPGITRRCVADLLQNNALMVTKYKKPPTLLMEKKLTKADIYTADCAILCGTYAEIVNIGSVDGRVIGDDSKHFYYKMLSSEYTNLVRGRNGE